MTTTQKIIKYLATAFAVFLTVSIIGGILGAIGLISLFSSGEDITGEMQTYSVSSGIREIDVTIKAADIHIKEGKSFSVESNLKNLKIEEKNGHLTIKDTTKLNFSFFSTKNTDSVLTLYIPEKTVLNKIKLTTGAGKLTVDNLSAENINFELGAGAVRIDNLVATKSADIEGGAGQITISDGAIKNMNLKMGIGQLNLTSDLSGNCRLNSGVGKVNVTLLGDKDDYMLNTQKGLGNISIDGKDISDNNNNIGNGTNKIKIQGGIGAINVNFETPKAK